MSEPEGQSKKRSRASEESDGEDSGRKKKVVVARGPRTSSFKTQAQLQQKDIEFLNRQLEMRDKQIARMEEDMRKLEKLLAEERSETKRYYQQIDGQKSAMMSDLTYHMAKSHHSAMQTIQTAQQTNAQVIASAFGQTMLRIKDKQNRMLSLMPPLPDLSQPNAKQLYHDRVKDLLTSKVKRMEDGKQLLQEIDSALIDCQQTIDDEMKRKSPDLSTQQAADLQNTIMEAKTRFEALKYERDMLANGLAKHTPPPPPTATPPPPPVPVASNTTPTAKK